MRVAGTVGWELFDDAHAMAAFVSQDPKPEPRPMTSVTRNWNMGMANQLTDQQWHQFERDGFIKLGKIADADEFSALQQRIDEIMLGKANLNYDRMLMQLDAGGMDYTKNHPQTKGYKGATLEYRKVESLEFDPLFLSYLQKPIFRDICARVYGHDAPIAVFRSMFFNKPARKGTLLPWHQDRWDYLDRDPLVTIWMALDPSTIANGCVRLIPGSHGMLVNPDNPAAFLTDEQAAQIDESKQVYLELDEGEVVLLHNWTLHSSGVNETDCARRAFSVCYMHANTVSSSGQGDEYQTVFGPGALTPQGVAATASTAD